MAFVKRSEQMKITIELLGSRNDKGAFTMYQTTTTPMADAAVATLGDTIKGVIEAISDCKVVGITYLSGIWDDSAYFPSTTGDMRDTGIFRFATAKRKNVQVQIPAFKRSLLVQTRVAAAGAAAPAGGSTAVALVAQDQLVNTADTDIETFVQLMIAGVSGFTPHAKRTDDGDIVALIDARFVQLSSKRRSNTMG